MALNNVQLAQTPNNNDQPFFNYGGTDLPVGIAIALDSTNIVGASGSAQGIGVMLAAASGDPVIGVTMETIPAGGYGRVRALGPICAMTADGAITAGTYVDASAVASKKGFAKAHAAGKATIGIALNPASADGDLVLVMLVGGFNA